MTHVAFASIRRLAALLAGMTLAILAGPAGANELNVVGSARGFVIHGPEETLRQFCARDDEGRLWLALPGGMRCELVTSTDDPAIFNKGDGAFHPFEEAEVRAALAGVRYPVGSLHVDVFLLPYPRRNGLESAAAPQLILLSPGVRALSREQQHAEFVHELGHVVQYALMPDPDTERWQRYREIRGIDDDSRFHAGAHHANRPHEIFAEDFRALFGGALANYSGSVENSDIPAPHQVSGLRPFLLGLVGEPGLTELRTQSNPARGPLRFYRAGFGPAPLDLFDVTGRLVATVPPMPAPGAVQWSWDGHDVRGARVPPGVLFARVRDGSRASLRVTLLP
jgi:hypothetical protein